MPSPDPIKLGSASGTVWTFESGSSVSTDEYGIQTCDVRALFPAGESVYSFIPAEGATFGSVFGNSYLPSTFLLDFLDGAPGIEYQDAKVARVTFKFKRIDPLFSSTNRRIVTVDSVINYEHNALSQVVVWTSGIAQNNVFGFPDPTATVTYSTATQPGIGSGGLSNLYALPGSANASGFPAVPTISIPYTFSLSAGAVISYWDGAAFQSFTVVVTPTAFVFNLNFISNPRGWQLVKLKYDPVANRNFFAVEETWRNFYSFQSVTYVSHTP